MATYNAIAATSEAIRRHLKEAVPPEFPQLDVEIYRAEDFQKSVPASGRLSVFLYRIAVNQSQRNHPPRTSEDGKTRFRPSLPVDLFYLISAWAMNAEFQQRLLGWCMRTLEDTPTLPAAVLNRLQSTVVFRRTETIDLICDPLSLQDLGVLWELAKENAPLSISYVARMIALDSEIALNEGAIVQTRAFNMGVPAEVPESLAGVTK